MAHLRPVLFAVFILQYYVNAVPYEPQEESITQTEEDELKLNSLPYALVDEAREISNDTQGQRQKRWYNLYGPPPPLFPGFPPRDLLPEYRQDDPYLYIYKRLQDIATAVRQPPPPPPPVPVYLPVFYFPPAGCDCSNSNNNQPEVPSDTNGTSPNVTNRFPEMEDTRQNWGLVVNDTQNDDDGEDDFSRPISFVPIRLNRTTSRPPPPVDHGSNQAGVSTTPSPQPTTFRPAPPRDQPPAAQGGSAQSQGFSPPEPAPSSCDSAILSCCHQAQVTYDCFIAQGCADLTSYGNPCASEVILNVILKFQRYYGQRNG